MEGVVNVSASIEQLPNEMIVQFRLSTVALRDLIDRIHMRFAVTTLAVYLALPLKTADFFGPVLNP